MRINRNSIAFILLSLLYNNLYSQHYKYETIGNYMFWNTYDMTTDDGVHRVPIVYYLEECYSHSDYSSLGGYSGETSRKYSAFDGTYDMWQTDTTTILITKLIETSSLQKDIWFQFNENLKPYKTWLIQFKYPTLSGNTVIRTGRISLYEIPSEKKFVSNNTKFDRNFILKFRENVDKLRIWGNFTTKDSLENSTKKYFQDENGETKKIIAVPFNNPKDSTTTIFNSTNTKVFNSSNVLIEYEDDNVKKLYNSKGVLREEYAMHAGFPHGTYKYYVNGKIIATGDYKNGEKNGHFQEVIDPIDIDPLNELDLDDQLVNLKVVNQFDILDNDILFIKSCKYIDGKLVDNQVIQYKRLNGKEFGLYSLKTGKFNFYHLDNTLFLKGSYDKSGWNIKNAKCYDPLKKKVSLDY